MQQAVNGGPAFPVSTRSDGDDSRGSFGHQDGHTTWQFAGLTKRELIAAMAMQGMLANAHEDYQGYPPESFADDAATYADALLAELAKDGAQ